MPTRSGVWQISTIMLSLAPCALCDGTTFRLVADMGPRKVVRCMRCHLVRADPLPTPEEKARIESTDYECDAACPEVQDLFKNYHRDYVVDPIILRMRRHLTELEQAIGGPGTVLDVGAATGIFLHLARERGWQPTGIELCAERAAEASREFDVPIHVGAFEDVDFDGARFDAISLLDVVEHTLDPLAFVRRAYNLLRPGGAVFVSLPNEHCLLTVLINAYARLRGVAAAPLVARLHVPLHVHYFTPRTLRRLLETAGLRVQRAQQAPVYLGRYTMPLWMRLPLQATLGTGALLGMNGRLEMIGVKD